MKLNNFQNKYQNKMLSIFLLLFVTASEQENLPKDKTLYTQNVLKLAKSSEMRSFMNPNAEPCYDFYEFACGNWAKINPENRSQKKMSTLDLLQTTYDRKIAILLDSNTKASDAEVDRKIKMFYKSCIDAVDNFDKNALQALLKEFEDYWEQKNFDWLGLLANIKRKFGLQILIGMDVSNDLELGTTNRLFIGQPPLKLMSKSLYLEEKGLPYRIAYRNEVAANLKKFTDTENSLAYQRAEEIVGFEILLAKGLLSQSMNNGNLTKETTIANLQTKYGSEIDFNRLLNLTLDYIPNGPIYEFNENYLEHLKNLIDETMNTTPHLLSNYVFYMTLKEFMPYNDIGNKHFDKKQFCIQKVKQHFAKPLDNMIYRNFNFAATEDDLKIIWHSLRKVFKSKLYTKDSEWITPDVREYAKEKLDEMKLEIDNIDYEKFALSFKNLNITASDYIKNLKDIFEIKTSEMFEKINKPSTGMDSTSYASSTIPYNMFSKNTIKLPVALLQPYFLWAGHYPTALKHGTLGFLIARALVHGFDDKGRLYNKDGELKTWWDEETTNGFMSNRDCFIQQYPVRKNLIPNLDMDSENIADNIGLNLAFEAFIDWIKSDAYINSKPNEILPNMTFSKEQFFFLSFAQLLCNDVDPYFQPSWEQHISGRYRVIGALTNLDSFSKAFNCTAESPMNPEHKCLMF